MTEKANRGNDVTEKPSEIPRTEEADQSGTENKTRDGATESIAVVKSKIREKNAEEEALTNSKAKMVSSKISKISKNKRGKSKSNEAIEPQEHSLPEEKTENVPQDNVNVNVNITNTEAVQSEALDMSSIVSKKSLMSKKSMAKSASRLIALTEDDDNAGNVTSNVTSKISIGGNYDNEESRSTFVIAHDAESQRERTLSNALDNVSELRHENVSIPRNVHVHERGNYLSSVTPSPLEDYPPLKETNEQKEQRERERKEKEQKIISERREAKERAERELREKEEREQREKEMEEQKALVDQMEQTEQRDAKEQTDPFDLKELGEQHDQTEQRDHTEKSEPKSHREDEEKK